MELKEKLQKLLCTTLVIGGFSLSLYGLHAPFTLKQPDVPDSVIQIKELERNLSTVNLEEVLSSSIKKKMYDNLYKEVNRLYSDDAIRKETEKYNSEMKNYSLLKKEQEKIFLEYMLCGTLFVILGAGGFAFMFNRKEELREK